MAMTDAPRQSEQPVVTAEIDLKQIMQMIPHRYPFLMIDKVVDVVRGQRATGVKSVTVNEPHFQGHFPRWPVMPGVLIIEALAQAAAILTFMTAGAKSDEQSVYYFVGIDGARFKKPVTAGDSMRMHVELVRHVRGIWKFRGEARVEGTLVAESELMCTVRSLREEVSN
jgi:3-hydroxyacyl-[acyl-carrier-protein] dehydratase